VAAGAGSAPAERPGRAAASLDLCGTLEELSPRRLADVHRSTTVGATVRLNVPATWAAQRLADIVRGAGFAELGRRRRSDRIVVSAERVRELPDLVGPAMRLLVVGLNPSLYAADAGVGFARPGNRFWPAMRAAGLATVDRDGRDLLDRHRIGMTDLVKRATVGAAELAAEEYRDGVGRLERMVAWLRPGAVCLLGLDGWRKAVDRRAVTGWQPLGVGGAPAYLMPNPSGLNAHATVASLAEHLRTAAAGPTRRPDP
jgi:TDG/mug DNA glycosylase family protein